MTRKIEMFELFREEQQRMTECLGAGRILLEYGRDGNRPTATLRLAAPMPLAGAGPLAGARFDLVQRVLGLPPSDDEDDDGEGFAIVEQILTVARPDGDVALAWRFGPNTGSLEIGGELRGGASLDGIALPTGFVPLEEVIRALIEGFGVEPQAEDWDERLETLEFDED